MSKNQKIWTSVAVLMTSAGLLVGCGHTSSSTPISPTNETNATTNGTSSSGPLSNVTVSNETNTTNASTDNTTVTPLPTTSNSAFPTVVQKAMSQLPSNLLATAVAPTQVPSPASGGQTVGYSTATSSQPSKGQPNFTSSYAVTLTAGNKTMASWSLTNYPSSSVATQGYQAVAGPSSSVNTNNPAIVLTGNHTAYVTNDAGGSTSIRWTQGKWNIRVTNQNTEVAPTPLADEVAEYLDKNPVPASTGTGDIAVVSPDSSDTNATASVVWQNDTNLFQVSTNSTAQGPVNAALAMAASMQPYSGK